MDSGHILGTTSPMRHYTAHPMVQWEIVKFNAGPEVRERTKGKNHLGCPAVLTGRVLKGEMLVSTPFSGTISKAVLLCV